MESIIIMSKIGKKPVEIPDGVTVGIKEGALEASGKNASVSVPILRGVKVEISGGQIIFMPNNDKKQTMANWGTLRALVQNAVNGANEDFVKKLIIEGVGYRAKIEGTNLVLSLGYSHPIIFPIPDGVNVAVEKSIITVAGAQRAQVGEVSAEIRKFRKPEPYKGKGIRYSDEVVRRKAGKKAVGAGE